MKTSKIVLPGGAGLVGQNLVTRLRQAGYERIVVIDKHRANLDVLRTLHPHVSAIQADLAEPGSWERHFEGAAAVVMLQAQIGAKTEQPFLRNNVTATEQVLAVMKRCAVPYLVHISSSVVESVADDFYTRTKRQQEQLVEACDIPHLTLRPTLMFGWFDRKHLGWLSRFMQKVPLFPIPGHGRYMRQPLYVGDFCAIIERCLETQRVGAPLNISGLEHIDYVDLIREIRRSVQAQNVIVHIPIPVFRTLLRAWALVDRDPPFTSEQLSALTAGDEFEIIDWQGLFSLRATPLAKALDETFRHPTYSKIALAF